MASLRNKGKVWYYRYTDEDGAKRERTGTTDRRVTLELARQAENEAAKIKAGMLDLKSLEVVTEMRRPISEHLSDHRAHLIAKGNTLKHADLILVRTRCLVAIVKGARLREIQPTRAATRADRDLPEALVSKLIAPARLSDLTAVRVQGALSDLGQSGLSLQTLNHYRAAIKGFSTWAWKDVSRSTPWRASRDSTPRKTVAMTGARSRPRNFGS